MSGISVGAALGAGFGLIRRRPLSVLAWGAILVGLQLTTFALFAPYYLTVYGALFESLAHGSPLPIEALSSPDVRRMQNLLQLFNLVQLLVGAVIYCAAFRAVLHPERSAFAYLRLGAPELFLVVVIVAAIIALVIGTVVVTIPIAIIVASLAAASHGGALAGLALIPLVLLLMLVAGLFVGLRFSLAGPMMVQDGRFHLFESWTLTRGRIGSLLAIALTLVGVFLLVDGVLVATLIGVGVAAVNNLGGAGPATALLHQPLQALLPKLGPVLAIYVIVHVPLAGGLVAIAGAPWARAYRDLLPDAAEAFA